MQFLEILERFKALGGTADNVELRYGNFGKGLFPVDPELPVKIITPSKLLISPNWIKLNSHDQIRFNRIYKIKLESDLVKFFEDYQQFFGWGNGGVNESHSQHIELKTLPERVKQLLLILGWVEYDFDKKDSKDYLTDYLIRRQIRIDDTSKIMPIIELINHSKNGKSFITDQGVKFEGLFSGEVLANYHKVSDAFHFFRNYGIASESGTVLSCDVKIEIPNIGIISISRFDHAINQEDGPLVPKIIKNKSQIHIPFLVIADNKGSSSSRKIFIRQMQKFDISKIDSNKIFDGLIAHNIKVREDLMVNCKSCLYKITKDLEFIASNQIKLIKTI